MPRVKCTSSRADAVAFWVGLGGYSETSQSLEQLGTAAECDGVSSTPTYYAWWEIVPAAAVTIPLKVKPGDTVNAAVAVSGQRVAMSLKNLTRHGRFSKVQTVSQALDISSAEWIAEAPASCTSTNRCHVVPLTDFGGVTFTNIAATGNDLPGTLSGPIEPAGPGVGGDADHPDRGQQLDRPVLLPERPARTRPSVPSPAPSPPTGAPSESAGSRTSSSRRRADLQHRRAAHPSCAESAERLLRLIEAVALHRPCARDAVAAPRRAPRRPRGSGSRPSGRLALPTGARTGTPGSPSCGCPRRPPSPPLPVAARAAGTSSPAGAKTIAASSSSGRSARRAGPLGSELAGERLRLVVALAREGEHPPALGERELGDDVRRGAEAVEAEPLGAPGEAERAPPDQPCAEKRRELRVGGAVGER